VKHNFSKITAIILSSVILFSGCSSNSAKKEEPADEFQGIVEATEVDLNSKIPGRIGKVNFEEGDSVGISDVLAVVDSQELSAKKSQAEALVQAALGQYEAAQSQVAAAQAMLQKAQNGARTQEIAQAQAYYDLMLKTYERVNSLYQKGAVPAQKLDEVSTQLEVARQQLEMANEGARAEDISGAQAMVASAMNAAEAARGKYEQAKAGLDEVQVYINDTNIKTPISGVVTTLNIDAGEMVSTGMNIATVSDLGNIWVEVAVDEDKLEGIKEGQTVDVRLSAVKDKTFKGEVTRINKKPDFAVKKASNDNGSYDIVSYGVKIKLDNSSGEMRPGMTAFVKFQR